MIVSGKKIAYLEPQQKVWHGEPGRAYSLTEVRNTDALKPFDGIEDFDFTSVSEYTKTLFRFPLRCVRSDLSENIYTTERLQSLIQPLVEEADTLLLFLSSVHTVEVYKINQYGVITREFGVKVAQPCQSKVIHERDRFRQDMKAAHHIAPFRISQCITSVVTFDIETMYGNEVQATSWLVANQVGSDREEILHAAAKQHVFPTVGVALQLRKEPPMLSCNSRARLFCFLPLPAEVTSPLPVHVNGTFGLSDNRRAIKWPTGEMQNDLAAQWNHMIVSHLLPSCYNLVLENAKSFIPLEFFYDAFPSVKSVSNDLNWSLMLKPLCDLLCNWECLWADSYQEWVSIEHAVVITPDNHQCLPEVVIQVLTKCRLKLATVPLEFVHILRLCSGSELKMLTPALCRSTLHASALSYEYESSHDKLELLLYCLMEIDGDYCDLIGLKLLPLADNSFIEFTAPDDPLAKLRYVCSKQFPLELLPGLKHRLVDLPEAKPELQELMIKVGKSLQTQLRVLTAESIVQLLLKCYPKDWKDKEVVDLLPCDPDFPFDWFSVFWKCIYNHKLSLFEGLLVIPLTSSDRTHISQMARLKKASSSSVVLLPENSYSECLFSTFKKLGINCTVCEDLLKHRQLNEYVNTFDACGVLTALSNSLNEIIHVQLTLAEASEVQTFLASHLRGSITPELLETLKDLCIIKVLNREEPLSLREAARNSWNGKVILEPKGFPFSSESLPGNLVVLSQRNEEALLDLLKSSVCTPNSTEDFVLDFLIPFVRSNQCHDSDRIDKLMERVFRLFSVFSEKGVVKFAQLTNELASLPFLQTEEKLLVRKSPQELYDPSKKELKSILHGKSEFPIKVFANDQHILDGLRKCRLRTTISGQTLLSILNENAVESCECTDPTKVNQEAMSRVRAVVSYICAHKLLDDHGFRNKISRHLCTKSWLPVVAKPPKHYPSSLVWKGGRCPCHFASPTNNLMLCDDASIESIPFIVGSQMFVSYCPSTTLCKLLSTDTVSVTQSVVVHFQHIIENVRSIENTVLDSLVLKVYSYLSSHLEQLSEIFTTSELCAKKLIWIRKLHKFVTPGSMFLMKNSTFVHSLQLTPYFDVVPENLQEKVQPELLKYFGVHAELTDSDIISVLHMINEDKSHVVPIKKVWTIIEHILTWLTEGGRISFSTSRFSLSESENVLVPIEGSDEEWPCLRPVQDVIYTDLDYLKSFQEDGATFIHDNFLSLAPYLSVKSLSKHLDISDDAFGDVGQHEPLVTRLKNILKDYKGGLTIIKELLQNADDAGATELTICYDPRTHSAEPRSLMFPGMANCHGPALLVHNNAKFTDEDFENITKLAGATKMDQPLKIGKFGIGFCSVYHITDIPSFISGKWLYIFDPCINYLKKEITNPIKPGKRISFTEKAVGYSKQLCPYENLFGFKQDTEYKETLFRFPFRTLPSELSTIVYGENHVLELATELSRTGSKLLLFLSNIKQIAFSQISEDMVEPSNICVIEKKVISEIIVDKSTSESENTFVKLVQVNVSCNGTIESSELWIVANSLHSFSSSSKPCVGSVAGLLSGFNGQSFSVKRLTNAELFCYLPLSIQTGLPVHVSANFAVLNDRTGIHASDSEKPTDEVQWNILLMKSVIPEAYYFLILAIKQLCIDGQFSLQDYKFYSLWPLSEQLKFHNPFDHMIYQMYQLLARSDLFYSSCHQKWLQLSSTSILSPNILSSSNESPPRCVVDVCKELQYPLIDLPIAYQELLPQESVDHCTVNERNFLDTFFKNIARLSSGIRNEVLMLTLKAFAVRSENYIEEYLKRNNCVPCTPDGEFIKKCKGIVDPSSSFSSLYDEEDGMFPLKQFYQDTIVRTSMQCLGMIQNYLPQPMVLERAKSIQPLYQCNPTKALQRSKVLIYCITQLNAAGMMEPCELDSIPFLPVMKRPSGLEYPECFQWFGDSHTLLCANQLLKGKSNLLLAGSQVCFLSELDPEDGGCGNVTDAIAELLGITLHPNSDTVIKHFHHIEAVYTNERNKHLIKHLVESACEQIYKSIELSLLQDAHCAVPLKSSRSIWTGNEFVSPMSVAKSWNMNGPVLYGIPHLLKSKENLIRALGIQETFTSEELLGCLKLFHDEYKGSCIEDTALSIAVNACKILGKSKLGSECYIPDENKHMVKACDLVYNDAPWCTLDDEFATVHEEISRRVALNLGVIPIRSKALQQYESQHQEWGGAEFGQHEKLTQRIKNILSQYPGDATIVKELLQNADDAKATKLYVILDKRQHKTSKLPCDNWKDLQGPALLVWNDSGFSDKDFDGIQKLGLGSKRSDTESIGQFGVGFNVVYHLTDCPSFLTNGNTLCVLDPHCRYVPGATTLRPGRRYDGVDERFWNRLCDLKTTYLLDEELHDCLKGIQGKGTLFRFPLRHTSELVKKSELVDKSGEACDSTSLFGSSSTPLDPDRMEHYIKEWAPKMKEALLFLNSVCELKFFVVCECRSTPFPSVTLTHSYSIQSDVASSDRKEVFLQHVKMYDHNKHPCIAQYSVCLVEDQPRQVSETWLIQQGIGDTQKPNQLWHYHQVKPKHGIATSLVDSDSVRRIFCFLPLPTKSRLPVHVNGNFILDAARSGLWKSRDAVADDKEKWNHKLIDAIASMYTSFLVTCQAEYVSTEAQSVKVTEMLRKYYGTFPIWLGKVMKPEGEMKILAEQVYHKLDCANSPILISKQIGMTSVYSPILWLPLHSDEEPSKQANFWSDGSGSELLQDILMRIGIHLTGAPIFIRDHFHEIDVHLPTANPETVYEYYQLYYMQVGERFPISIWHTKFRSVSDFLKFVKYLLRPMPVEISYSSTFLEFPSSPVDIPLLLTADEKLCRFSDTDKVICSKFSHIFALDVRKYFAHKEIYDLKLNPDYFIKKTDDNWELIQTVLDATIPTELQTGGVVDAKERESIKRFLTDLWKCFSSEVVFKEHFNKIVKKWTLFLSTKDELFAYRSNELLPIIEPPKESKVAQFKPLSFHHQDDENLKQHNDVFQILQKHMMPILDLSVVDLHLCLKVCPRMSQPTRILQNLYHLHQANRLSLSLDSELDNDIAILFNYFSSINFVHEAGYLQLIRSLPLFKDINGTYRTLDGRVYIWPDHVCLSGRDKWMNWASENVFLPVTGTWTKLGGATVLGVENMSSLVFYMDYIFPRFHLLSDDERVDHLRFIRDTPQLFDAAFHDSCADYDDNRKNESAKFINRLRQLECLKKRDHLRCISDFCDPTAIIFEMFVEKHEFPPESLSDEKWLEFFRKIGLRTEANQQEFISFCKRVASGGLKHISEASRLLLEYLFKKKNWHNDGRFLFEVSQITFVCAEDLKDLACIVPVVGTEQKVQQGNKAYMLTSLSKAAAKPSRNLVWTIKPVVELPRMPDHYSQKETQEFTRKLQLCIKPSNHQVLANISNISKSRFAHFELFDVYPEGCTQQKGKDHLLCKVMHESLTYLVRNKCPQEELGHLEGIPCIPVSRSGDVTDRSSPVLVPPLQVVASNSRDVTKLVPFINPLPNDMYPILPLLSEIGVHSDIDIHNIQQALQIMYDNIDPPITNDPNVLEVAKHLMRCIYHLGCLPELTGVLYLPNEAKELVDSTKLLFNDVERFKGGTLVLTDTPYSFMSLLTKKLEELTEYGFRSSDFYSRLPKSVQPLPLSAYCKETLSEVCRTEGELSEFAATIDRALKFPDFVKVVKILMTSISPDKTPTDEFMRNLERFRSCVKVLAVTDLQVDVYLTLISPAPKIGTVKVDFLLQSEASGDHSLHIDKDVYALKLNLLESLTTAIVTHVVGMGSATVDIQAAERAFGILLKAPTVHQIEELLNDQGINMDGIELKSASTTFIPNLGKPIPEEWHHRLHCDIHNAFKPQEWVGYEGRENHIVFARVEYRVSTPTRDEEGVQGEDNQQSDTLEELDQYSITISEDEQDGQEVVTVTVLDLYKILRVKRSKHDDGSTEIILYDPDSESVQLWDAIKDGKLKAILKEVYRELKRISMLKKEEQKRKAIKAMYLKWHPDKNLNPLASKAFQYLQRQIQRLQQGLLLENPDETDEESQPAFTPNSYWDTVFRSWDNIARFRSSRWRQERTHYDWSGTSSGGSYHYNGSFYFDGVMNSVSVAPDPNTAKVWMKQAEHDLNALAILAREINTHRDVCAHTCFMAHQVAEKALKAGMYQVIGLHSSALKHHFLVGHANAVAQIRSGIASGLHTYASKLESFYLDPRYPNRYNPVQVPSDQYTPGQATAAKAAAEKIVEIVKILF